MTPVSLFIALPLLAAACFVVAAMAIPVYFWKRECQDRERQQRVATLWADAVALRGHGVVA